MPEYAVLLYNRDEGKDLRSEPGCLLFEADGRTAAIRAGLKLLLDEGGWADSPRRTEKILEDYNLGDERPRIVEVTTLCEVTPGTLGLEETRAELRAEIAAKQAAAKSKREEEQITHEQRLYKALHAKYGDPSGLK